MKPAFALDFRDDTISLLHRSGSGWQLVGAVPLDTPDLTEALGYLRATALGLSPRGMATKLVIPNEQILYLTLHAPGPDPDSRAAQVAAALEGRTPYDVADLAYDVSGDGADVQVAVIAKETLAEAEAFATEHRLNPIAFVAAPDGGVFAGEPWFGLSSLAPSLMAAGGEVERDAAPVMMVARGFAATAPVETEAVVEPEAVAEVTADAEALVESEYVAEPEFVAEAEFRAEPVAEIVAEPVPEVTAQPELALEPAPKPTPASAPEPFPEAYPDAEASQYVPFESKASEAEAVGREAQSRDLQPRPLRASEPVFIEPRRPSADGGDDDRTLIAALADTLSAPIAQPAPPPPVKPAPPKPLPEVEEAPMALDVADDEADNDTAQDAEPQGADVIRAALSAQSASGQPNSGQTVSPQSARVIDPAIDDDLPPMHPASALGAFSSRRQANDPLPSKAPALGGAKDGGQRSVGAKPLAGPPPSAQRPGIQKPEALAKATKPAKSGLRGLSSFVSSASTATASGTAKPRSKVAIPSALPPLKSTNAASASATSQATTPPRPAAARAPGGFAAREPVRGKPRYLGLVLTVVLLFLLAMVAAWSSYTMGAWNASSEQPVQVGDAGGDGSDGVSSDAGTDFPDANDEMLADMQDPAALSDTASVSDPGAAPVEEVVNPPAEFEDAAQAGDQQAGDLAAGTATEPAPTLQVAAETPAPVNPTAGTDDEIFLASMDAAPAASDPLTLNQPLPQGDSLPSAQPAPPPFGTVYQFEPNGTIVPTPEGVITPEGVVLRAGKPEVVPGVRTAAVIAAAAALKPAPADAAALVDPAAVAAAVADAQAEAPVYADPALAGKKPKLRPAGLAAPTADQGALAPAVDTRLAGLRPAARPGAILAAGRQAQQASAAASLTAQAEAITQASAVSGGSKLAIAISRKPAARPRDLSRAVEAAVAAVAREPQPEPEAEVAAVAPSRKAQPEPEKNGAAEADNEPEIASAAPKIPTKATVAKQATFKNAINLSKLNLIGVYGTQSKRYALVRTANGRYKKVRVGDTIDGGGRVAAITATEVRYQKGGRLVALAMPKS
ncbi:hypothetical protein GCM10010873_28940 [Cypionkella aquatica]|uniref:Type IV pilus biogenesis protein PilP n=1 Tax=Cypionkella aquatica TaxID=1756042 RepID=A0AA37X346_9RHOB|nr:hypothetical protein [Cypionkella aquatica]GLS87920.1 hypothetical protein GCM10010873_28940 [Cypionkella aquatica]